MTATNRAIGQRTNRQGPPGNGAQLSASQLAGRLQADGNKGYVSGRDIVMMEFFRASLEMTQTFLNSQERVLMAYLSGSAGSGSQAASVQDALRSMQQFVAPSTEDPAIRQLDFRPAIEQINVNSNSPVAGYESFERQADARRNVDNHASGADSTYALVAGDLGNGIGYVHGVDGDGSYGIAISESNLSGRSGSDYGYSTSAGYEHSNGNGNSNANGGNGSVNVPGDGNRTKRSAELISTVATANSAKSPARQAAQANSGETELSPEQLITALIDIVSQRTGYPPEMLDPALDLEADLGIDSIKRVEILNTFRRLLPESKQRSLEDGIEKLAGVKSLQGIMDWIRNDLATLGEQTSGGTAPVRIAPVETAPVNSGLASTNPVQTAPVNSGLASTDPVQTAPVKTGLASADPVQTAPVKTGLASADPVRTDIVNADLVNTDSVSTDPGISDTFKTGPVGTEFVSTNLASDYKSSLTNRSA